MSNLISLPERNMNPPEPTAARCEKCGSDGETWLVGSKLLCTPEALLEIAEMTLDGLDRLDALTLVMVRDILDASMQAAEARLLTVTGVRGGCWPVTK